MSTKPRVKSANIYDVAREAGVSISTVSRALNKTGAVADDVLLRVNAATKRLGYIPLRAAQSLSSQRTFTMGTIVPTIDYSIFARKVEAFQARASELGYNVVIVTSDFDAEEEYKQCVNLIKAGAEAIMLEGERHLPELFEMLRARGIPYVNTSAVDYSGEHPTIGFDNRLVSKRAIQHLFDLGHRRFGVLAGIEKKGILLSSRLDGIREHLAARGLTLPDTHVAQCSLEIEDSRRAFAHLMAATPRPTAIICSNDVLALGAMLEAGRSGIAIPGEVSVVGFDDLDWAAHLKPSLTTFYVPTAEMGVKAADYLSSRLKNAQVGDSIEIQVPLILRDSTGPAPSTA